MSDPATKNPPSPLATPEPWDLVRLRRGALGSILGVRESALELANVAPGSDVLDVCTGPGTLAMQAAVNARLVVGVDFSPRMLEEFRRPAEAAGLRNVKAVEADGQTLPFGDNHVPQQRVAWRFRKNFETSGQPFEATRMGRRHGYSKRRPHEDKISSAGFGNQAGG